MPDDETPSFIDSLESDATALLATRALKAQSDRKDDEAAEIASQRAALESLAQRLGYEDVEDAAAAERTAREAELSDDLDTLIQLRAVAKDPVDELVIAQRTANHIRDYQSWIDAQPARRDIEARKAAADTELIAARRQWRRGEVGGFELAGDREQAMERLGAALKNAATIHAEHEAATDNVRASAALSEWMRNMMPGSDD